MWKNRSTDAARRARPIGLVTVVVMVLVLAAACGGSDEPSAGGGTPTASDSESAAAVSDSDLAGATYVSSSVSGHDMVEGSTITLAFDGGNLSVSAGCNTQFAAYELADTTLRWKSPAGSTMMACSDELTQQDAWLNTLFTDGVTVTGNGSGLTLTKDDVTIELSKQT